MTFREEWGGFTGVFGGRVVAELAAAVTRAPNADEYLAGLVPASLHAEFSAAVDLGAAEVTAEVLHAGRRTARVATAVRQGHRRASASVKMVRAGEPSCLPRRDLRSLPTPESLSPFVPPYPPMAYSALTEIRLVEHTRVNGQPSTRVWVRLDDASPAVTELDPTGRAAVLLDIVPPGPFFADAAPAFVPTVDFSLHRAPVTSAPGGWHYAESTTEWWADGFCAESATLWSADGTFVARGTQNRRVVFDA
ncbi:thioesterase family protein [Nocardioides alcanivorans]|uniref:thioesterase family protein n=1 Tax=Nocardioides alcanivorans TaxID=2897352 RepID=UPI001F3E9383|nr:thioesterase family protein [Nocardioides alcanivorans]